jgi:hypothetical protein
MPNLNITQIPAPRVPFLDERSGLISREWYLFFQNIFILTGSGSNATTLEELQLGPPTQPGVTSVTGVPPVVSSGGATPAISMPAATSDDNGYLTSTDWNTFNNKGTVSSVSVVSANGLAGTVATATTTPAVTLSTTVTGVLKGDGTAISAATSGTDYAPATSGTSILYGSGAGGFSNVTIGTGVAFAAGTLSATGSGGTVTSVTGTAPVVSSGGATPAISIAAATTSVNGYLTSTDWNTFNGKGSGSVTSVAQSFTGGLISVAGSPITTSGTLALTVAGTSGGIPYFSSGTTWATSAALAANALVLGGGAGAAPATTTTGTGVVTALGVNTGTAGAFVVDGGALGTPASGVVTNLTGTASININGTVGATTPATGAFTTLSATGVATFAAGTVALPSITTSGDTNTGIYFPAADTVAVSTGGTERMRINSSGKVLVGTTTDTGVTVQIASNANAQTAAVIPTVRLTNLDTTAVLGDVVGSFEFYSIDASDPNVVTGFMRNVAEDAGVNYALTFGSDASTERMRITSNGALLIANSGAVNGSPSLWVANGGITAIFGADSNFKTLTDSTTKLARIGFPHYLTSEESCNLCVLSSSSTANSITFGGGTANFNAATLISFYTAANNTTVTGTLVATVNANGFAVGTVAASANVRIRVNGNYSDITGTTHVQYLDYTHTQTATNANQFRGISSIPTLANSTFTNTTATGAGGALVGFYSTPGVSGTGTVTGITGVYSQLRNSSTAIVTDMVAYQTSFVNSGGGTVTNTFGFKASATTVGTNNYGFHGGIAAATGDWNLYMAGTAQNYLLGVTGIGITPSSTAALTLAAGTTGVASLRIPHGAAPTSPVNGDMWTTTAGLYVRINGSTVGPLT